MACPPWLTSAERRGRYRCACTATPRGRFGGHRADVAGELTRPARTRQFESQPIGTRGRYEPQPNARRSSHQADLCAVVGDPLDRSNGIYVVTDRLETASATDETRAERELGCRFPAGYAEYVQRLGRGSLDDVVRVMMPGQIVAVRGDWRARRHEFWFRDDPESAVGQHDVLGAVPVAALTIPRRFLASADYAGRPPGTPRAAVRRCSSRATTKPLRTRSLDLECAKSVADAQLNTSVRIARLSRGRWRTALVVSVRNGGWPACLVRWRSPECG